MIQQLRYHLVFKDYENIIQYPDIQQSQVSEAKFGYIDHTNQGTS